MACPAFLAPADHDVVAALPADLLVARRPRTGASRRRSTIYARKSARPFTAAHLKSASKPLLGGASSSGVPRSDLRSQTRRRPPDTREVRRLAPCIDLKVALILRRHVVRFW